MIVAGIDSAELTGYAILESGSACLALLRHGAVKISTGADVELVATELATAGAHLLAVEAPFVKPAARGGNPHSALELATLVGRWLQAAEVRAIPTGTVLASTWQPAILKGDRWAPREARKAAAVRWAAVTFGVTLTEDEADAACIAAWAIRHQQPARLEQRRTPLTTALTLPGVPL
jgi:Holliday junction resolvasome RuvABC endonuclease subunit